MASMSASKKDRSFKASAYSALKPACKFSTAACSVVILKTSGICSHQAFGTNLGNNRVLTPLGSLEIHLIIYIYHDLHLSLRWWY
ncbi:unnamed protein product [Ectocarpus sp. CCAP 1310/34]|nr:unnamed protein product [Ectocarpus sp. CCAP 1310/34]